MTFYPPVAAGEVFLDERGGDRCLRVTWHSAEADQSPVTAGVPAGVVVLSLWRGELCVGTFRLDADQVEALVEVLRAGLDESGRSATEAVSSAGFAETDRSAGP